MPPLPPPSSPPPSCTFKPTPTPMDTRRSGRRRPAQTPGAPPPPHALLSLATTYTTFPPPRAPPPPRRHFRPPGGRRRVGLGLLGPGKETRRAAGWIQDVGERPAFLDLSVVLALVGGRRRRATGQATAGRTSSSGAGEPEEVNCWIGWISEGHLGLTWLGRNAGARRELAKRMGEREQKEEGRRERDPSSAQEKDQPLPAHPAKGSFLQLEVSRFRFRTYRKK